jgi:hypothetical protein
MRAPVAKKQLLASGCQGSKFGNCSAWALRKNLFFGIFA